MDLNLGKAENLKFFKEEKTFFFKKKLANNVKLRKACIVGLQCETTSPEVKDHVN